MRSLKLRLTLWHALTVTATLGLALAAGGWLLHGQMIRGTDLLHNAEFEEIRGRLGPDSAALDAAALAARIRHHTEIDAALYYFQVHDPSRTVLFRSPNLGAAILPDLGDQPAHWTAMVPPHGRLRISEFHAGPWHVQIASALAPVDRLMGDYARVAGLLAGLIALASLLLGYAFSRYALAPVRTIAGTAQRISADNLGERIPMPEGGGEMAELARLLNGMFDRLEASFTHARRFSADVSHELKTPLALIRLNAEKLRHRVAGDPEATAQVGELLEDTARLHGLIERLLFIARAESGTLALDLKPTDPAPLVAEFAQDARALADDAGVRFELPRNEPGTVRCDPPLIRQLLFNLTTNALRASRSTGTITLSAGFIPGRWRLELDDEGAGLAAAQLDRIFERFVRFPDDGGEPGPGHGLGLAICRSIVELHGGTIQAANRTDRSGLRVVVELPVGGA